MTAPFYTEPLRLDDYFYRLLNRCVSDRKALDWMQIHIDSSRLIIVPPLPTKPYVLRLTERRCLVIDTNIDPLDPNDPDPPLKAADFQVTIVSDAPLPPIPDDEPYVIIAAGGRRIPRGYVLTPPDPPAPPTVEIKTKTKTPPAPKRANREGALNRTKAATAKRIENAAPAMRVRWNKIEAAFAKADDAKKPRPSAQQLADKFHVSLRTIKRDLEHFDDAP
jgi:hypothetical protein